MIELKPCPFCGCKLEQRAQKLRGGETKTVYVHPDNGCVLLALYVDGTNMYAWNHRAGEEKGGEERE